MNLKLVINRGYLYTFSALVGSDKPPRCTMTQSVFLPGAIH